MTMDIYQRAVRPDSSPPIIVDGFRDHPSSTMHHSSIASKKPSTKPVKRSFDVAFLMAPDDLSKKREHRSDMAKKSFKFANNSGAPHSGSGEAIMRHHLVDSRSQYQLNPLSLTIHSAEKLREELSSADAADCRNAAFLVRSAFTKVNSSSLAIDHHIPRTPPVAISPSSVSSTTSNRSAMSPDLTYQDSLSPQSFVPARSPVQLLNKQYSPMSSPNLPFFVTAGPLLKESKEVDEKAKFSSDFLDGGGGGGGGEKKKYSASHHHHHHHLPKQAPQQQAHQQPFQYHAENVSMPYAGFPMSGFPFTPSLPTAATSVPIFPSAANLTAALLPTSLAALTLPAQNICAKCNMHFRMTSDLVYHMRSHHKNENGPIDPYKRRRDQDKLKCPVCNESFRERHHLTRHMTAHQDKEDEGSGAAVVKSEFVDTSSLSRTISGNAK